MRLFLLLWITHLLLASPLLASPAAFQQLDQAIASRAQFVEQKEETLLRLKRAIQPDEEPHIRFAQYQHVFQAYSSYQYDSSYVYAQHTLQQAELASDRTLLLQAHTNLLFCFLSSGSFKEGADMVAVATTEGVDTAVKGDYFAQCARFYSDMASYNAIPSYREQYRYESQRYCDSAQVYLNPQSFEAHFIQTLRMGDTAPAERITIYRFMMDSLASNPHQYAIAASNLANVYTQQGDTLRAIPLLAAAALADIQESVMETTAKTVLAEHLYAMGDLDAANRYIQEALQEANFYHAKHRILNINSILPIIERAHIAAVRQQRDYLAYSLSFVTLLSLLCVWAYSLLRKEKQKLQLAQNDLAATNQRLCESDEIKNTYILQSLYAKSDYLDKVEKLVQKIDFRIMAKKYGDLQKIPAEFNIKRERKELFLNFDQAFLLLFPHFVEHYNLLFQEKDRVQLESNGSLSPELRIFALIRLGIDDNEQISQFLNLSINTIYAYKTKAKGRSLISNDQFEEMIRKIPQNRV